MHKVLDMLAKYMLAMWKTSILLCNERQALLVAHGSFSNMNLKVLKLYMYVLY